MRAFREVIDDCGLQDLGWCGMEFTWDNAQAGNANVKARLDRAFGNTALLNLFTSITVRHIGVVESDHCFVMVRLQEYADQRTGRARPFRYEDVWQTHADYDQLILDKWRCGEGGQRLLNVAHALSTLQHDLSLWGAKEFGCLLRKIRKLRDRLNRLRLRSLGRGSSAEEKDFSAQLKLTLKQEEIWMRQRSRVLWLREGDRNTGYFQAQASQRKRINRIESLVRVDGTRCSQPDEIQAEISLFYQELYTSRGFHPLDALLDSVPVRVSGDMNDALTKAYTEEEIRYALFQMAPSKAPGVDGFTTGFFQRHWQTLKKDIVPALLEFLNGGDLLEGMNDTSITLIPKVPFPQKISQFCPISLCPVLYKIAAKAIANQLRGCLDEVIGEEQSAFVPGRLITDNVLIAYESVHSMRRHKRGKNAVCAVKLDMMKAYDRVEWHYLEAIMLRLGFHTNFVKIILKCVSSVRFSVWVNGELLPFFTPTCGLRQGDPVSPYLFLLCAEGFTSLLNYYGGAQVDHGIRASYRSSWINHLLFVDDSLIFMQASVSNGHRLNEILRIYEECSGQTVDKDKSSIYFSPNTSDIVRQRVKLCLNFAVEAFSERYLGLPTVVGRIMSGTFDHIHERIRTKLQGGVERMLSCAGREVRLKTVAQAIPTFSMSCFRLTRKVCKSLVSLMAKYWWSSSVDRQSLHWLSWDAVSEPK
ncbi:hypothetical protein D1007_19788 [Hordeum vulgare]|nr:hypothetical protein D1007_19788 [Hordeum vulgare]